MNRGDNIGKGMCKVRNKNGPHWFAPEIDLWASVEPGGVQIAGNMPDDIWDVWYTSLKQQKFLDMK